MNNIAIEIKEPYIEQIKNIFKELNVPVIKNNMYNFDLLIDIINDQTNNNLDNNMYENYKLEKNIFFSSINEIKDYITITNIFSVPIFFYDDASNIIEIKNINHRFLYLLIGESHTKDYFYTGEGTNKWINLLNNFIIEITPYKNFIET